METSSSLTRPELCVMKWAGISWGTGFQSCFPLVCPQSIERDSELPGDQGQSEALLIFFSYQCPYVVQRCRVQTSDLCRGWYTGKHSWLVAGAVSSHKRGHRRGRRTGNSRCSASAKFYNSLDECKKKRHFIFALKGAKFNSSNTAE